MDYAKYIGLYFGEQSLSDWLARLGIQEKPRLKRGDDTTFLANRSQGIELSFEDSEFLSRPQRAYPDGALVLSNIRFYGVETDDFSVYTGELPFGIRFAEDKANVVSRIGVPEAENPKGTKLRWNKDGILLFVSLDDNNRVAVVSIQHPA